MFVSTVSQRVSKRPIWLGDAAAPKAACRQQSNASRDHYAGVLRAQTDSRPPVQPILRFTTETRLRRLAYTDSRPFGNMYPDGAQRNKLHRR
jgi:hypothetical protein